MRFRLPTHLSPEEARARLDLIYREEHHRVAEGLALLALIDSRRDFRAAGYSCMKTYCEQHLRMTPDRASKRLQAARTAVRFTTIFDFLSDGRLTLGAVVALAPHLKVENSEQLLAAAAHKTRAEILQLVVARSTPMVTTTVASAPTVSETSPSHAPGHVSGQEVAGPEALAFIAFAQESAAPLPPKKRGVIALGAPGEHEVRLTLTQQERDALRRVQDLLSNTEWAQDPAAIYAKAIELLEERLLKDKLGAKKSEQTEDTVGNGRRIPKAVRHAVWERDGGCCSFVSADGHRCGERRWLQFDHRTPVALGGESTLANVRLLCRAHNLFEAERVLGEDRVTRARERAERERARHSEAKAREAARAAAREAKARAAEEKARLAAEKAAIQERDADLLSALKSLQFTPEQAARAAEATAELAGGPLEPRVRAALKVLTARLATKQDFSNTQTKPASAAA
ncbi:MAG: HNH endonuclease [Candidatus Eisenbacteria bacterium]|nr:HNH endonuclease [Candidatus Eisenbacteria bacterium]